jgi:hypothetical protein
MREGMGNRSRGPSRAAATSEPTTFGAAFLGMEFGRSKPRWGQPACQTSQPHLPEPGSGRGRVGFRGGEYPPTSLCGRLGHLCSE